MLKTYSVSVSYWLTRPKACRKNMRNLVAGLLELIFLTRELENKQ